MRGWMAYQRKLRNIDEEVFGYETLRNYFDYFKTIIIINFDDKAANIFKELKSSKIRIGTMDLKIASIALANDAILVSRNLSDFEQIPGLRVKNWAI